MATTPSTGLYSSRFERDSCGFGLIADLDDRASRSLVEAALTALSRLAHRGAVGGDGHSGDGCGLLIHRPEAFLRIVAAEAGISLGKRFAAGMVFLPVDASTAKVARATLDDALAAQGLRVAGWREVPVSRQDCGPIALAGMPRIEQVFVDADGAMSLADLQRALFLSRRAAEKSLRGMPEFYVVSLSATTLGYKAMVLPDDLAAVYPDLARADLASSVVVFHQRFSTNTAPAWKLAQPFRLLAHNGEINTIEGNRHWSRARGARWSTPRVDFSQVQPLVSLDGSDSQSLDNMENYRQHLRGLIRAHIGHTGSVLGQRLLDDFRDVAGRFWLVKPKAASLESLVEALRRAA